jgi:hypothetical protein
MSSISPNCDRNGFLERNESKRPTRVPRQDFARIPFAVDARDYRRPINTNTIKITTMISLYRTTLMSRQARHA